MYVYSTLYTDRDDFLQLSTQKASKMVNTSGTTLPVNKEYNSFND